jgi:predicted ATPase/DNA-binding CsgD family transcriptional regulator
MCAAPGSEAPVTSTVARDPRTTVDFVQPLMSFVGRSRQLSAVTTLLREPGLRLLTLTGPGGVGKTRLAEVAADVVREAFPDGVIFISFATLRDPSRVPGVIADAFGLLSVTGESFESRVINHARDREMLLVLDNLEHLLPVPFLTRLLVACEGITIMATSREVLRLSGEFEYVVPPLAVPDPDIVADPTALMEVESVALLVDRARQVRPGLTVDASNAADIAAICRRLDGLPLAIELAAARLKIFSPSALLARLSDRLSLLTGGPSDRPLHQRTIRDTIGWSYDLLPEGEQCVFRRLGAFAGDITPEAVAATCADASDAAWSELEALDHLCLLVDKSLLQRVRQDADEPRFVMLETIRHYALERLQHEDELDDVSRRYAQYHLDLAESAVPHLIGPEQTAWAARLESEQPNMRAAMAHFRDEQDAESYTRLVCALWRFWRLRGMLTEGRAWLEETLPPAWQDRLPPALQSRSRFMAGWLALEQGDAELAMRLGNEALEIAEANDLDEGRGAALRLLSFVDSRLGDNARATRRMEASLGYVRKTNDADSIAGALNNLAILALDAGDYEQVVTYGTESRQRFLDLGNTYGASHSIDTMGVALYCLGRFEEAMRASRESMTLDRQLEDTRGLAVSLDHVGKCARALGDLPAAWEAHSESLRYRREVGDPRGFLVWLEAMALWLVHAGCPEPAARAFGAIEVTRTASNMPIQLHETADHEETERLACEGLGAERFETLVAKGRWLSLPEIVDEVQRVAEARVRELAGGEVGLSASVAERYGLTAREHEVLGLLAKRYADKEIAQMLSISPRTVARHVTGILTKMDVHSRREAAALAEDVTLA